MAQRCVASHPQGVQGLRSIEGLQMAQICPSNAELSQSLLFSGKAWLAPLKYCAYSKNWIWGWVFPSSNILIILQLEWWVYTDSFHFISFHFIYFEKEHEQGRGREIGREKIPSRLHTVSRAQRRAQSYELWDHNWSQDQESDRHLADWAIQAPESHCGCTGTLGKLELSRKKPVGCLGRPKNWEGEAPVYRTALNSWIYRADSTWALPRWHFRGKQFAFVTKIFFVLIPGHITLTFFFPI